MAISDDLNSIRTHLEDDYTALEQLGVSVEDRNIENIKDMANQIYAKFPKTSYAEGSNITLSNTLKGKLDFEDDIVGYGDTSQYSTTGINLYNPSLKNVEDNTTNIYKNAVSSLTLVDDEFTFVASGNDMYFGDVTQQGSNYDKNKGNKIYIGSATKLSYRITNSDFNRCHFTAYNSNNISLGFTGITGNTGTYTIPSNTSYITIRFGKNNAVSGTTYKTKVIVASGDTIPEYEDYTGNSPSPSPSYPQEIEVVRGKNRANMEWFEDNYTLNDSGLPTAFNGRLANTTPINVSSLDEVTISYKPTSKLFIYSLLDNNNTLIRRVANNTSGTTINTSTASKLYISFYDNATLENMSEIQLEKGSQATSYLPYNTLEVVERGKNLFNPDVTGLFKFGCNATESNGEITITATQNGDIYVGNVRASGDSYETQRGVKIPVKPNTQYTVTSTNSSVNKIFITEYNSNDISLGYIQNTTITTQINTSYITIRYGLENAVNGISYKTKIMVAEGTDSTYEPYQTPQTYQLSLGEYEFAKIGDYVDTIEYDVDEDKVYLNKNIGKILLKDIPRGWAKSGYSTDEYFCGFTNFATSLKTNSYYMLCNKLINALYSDTTTSECIANDQESVNLKIKASRLSENSVDGFINYIENEGSDIYILYILKEAVTEEITDTTLKDQIKALYYSQSFNGTTILEVDGDLPMIIKARALKGESN